MRFCVVEFLIDCSCAIVSSRWLFQSHADKTLCCYWPGTVKSAQYAQKNVPPNVQTWDNYAVRQLYETDSYAAALAANKRAESTSALESDSETLISRKRKVKKKKHPEFSYGLANTSTVVDNEEANQQPLPLERKNTADLSDSAALIWPQLPESISEPEMKQRKMNSSGDAEILDSGADDEDPGNEVAPVDTSKQSSQFPSKEKWGVTSTPRRTDRHRIEAMLEGCSSFAMSSAGVSDRPNSADGEILKKILICMQTILEKVEENKAHLVRLELGKCMPAHSSTQNLECIIKQPATSTEELKGIEEKLEEKAVKDAAILYLSLVGGRNVKATIREVLKKIATKHLLVQYSKNGQKGKKRFKDHKIIYSLLLCTCRKAHGKATLQEIETAISEVLKSYNRFFKKKSSSPNGNIADEEIVVDEE